MKSRIVAGVATISAGKGSAAPAQLAVNSSPAATAGAASAAAGLSLQREFELEPDPERARVGLASDAAQIGCVVFDSARSIEPEFAKSDASRHRRAESMLRFFAMLAEGENPIILDPRFEMRIEAEPRLRRDEHARRADAARPHLLGEEQICRIEHTQPRQLNF